MSLPFEYLTLYQSGLQNPKPSARNFTGFVSIDNAAMKNHIMYLQSIRPTCLSQSSDPFLVNHRKPRTTRMDSEVKYSNQGRKRDFVATSTSPIALKHALLSLKARCGFSVRIPPTISRSPVVCIVETLKECVAPCLHHRPAYLIDPCAHASLYC